VLSPTETLWACLIGLTTAKILHCDAKNMESFMNSNEVPSELKWTIAVVGALQYTCQDCRKCYQHRWTGLEWPLQ